MKGKRYKKNSTIYLVWVLAALFTSTQLYLKTLDAGGDESWLKLFLVQFLVWSVWGMLSPMIFWFGKKYRIDKQSNHIGVLLHLSFAVVLVLFYLGVYSMIWNFLGIGSFSWESFKLYFKIFFLNLFHWHFFIYMAIIGIAHAMHYQNEMEERRNKASMLEKQLLISELNTLKAQLSPHFLFNTINNVVSTIEQGKNSIASGMLLRLGSFLRHSLEESKHSLIPLEKEIDYLEEYLEIEKFRNRDLEVVIDKEERLLSHLVPNFILQPLVENAIKHGITKAVDANRIEIGMKRLGDTIRLWVYNEGPRLDADSNYKDSGVGLRSVVSRLEFVYGDLANLELVSINDGVMAEIILPIEFP